MVYRFHSLIRSLLYGIQIQLNNRQHAGNFDENIFNRTFPLIMLMRNDRAFSYGSSNMGAINN